MKTIYPKNPINYDRWLIYVNNQVYNKKKYFFKNFKVFKAYQQYLREINKK
jgi:hypothetical protein